LLVHGKCFEVANGMRLHPGLDSGIEITATDRTVPFVHCCIPSEDIVSDVSLTITGITVPTIYKLPSEGLSPEIIVFQAGLHPLVERMPSDRWTTDSAPMALLEKGFYAYTTMGRPE
jgi:hypothetical protein